MKVQSQLSGLKIVQNEEKWVIHVSEDLDMRNTTLDTGLSLKQILILCCLFLAALANRKVKNTFNSN